MIEKVKRPKDSHGSIKRRILGATLKRQARSPDDISVTSPPMSAINSVIGICRLCSRPGLVNGDGACSGVRMTNNPLKLYEDRSKRCREILELRLDRDWGHTRTRTQR